jgi:hypothetical protein
MHLRRPLLTAEMIVFSTKQQIEKFLDQETDFNISHMKVGAYNGDTFNEIVRLLLISNKRKRRNIYLNRVQV